MKNSERLLITVVLNILFLNVPGFAQQRQPDRGFQAGNSYAVSDIETINTTNGNLMLNIPLASLPAGRGTSPGFTLSLVYNSKLYDGKQVTKNDGYQNEVGNTTYNLELLNQSDEGGWHLNLLHRLKLTERGETEEPQPCDGSYYLQKNSYINKLSLEMPGGGITEFKPGGYTDQYLDGFYNISPFGVQGYTGYATVGGGSASCSYTTTQVNTTGMNYVADDGSGARLYIPHQQNQAAETLRWTLYYPDGKTVERSPVDDTSIAERITDRNGNQVVIKGDTFNGAGATKIEDNAGHYIIMQGNTVYSQGFGGELLPTVIQWKTFYTYRSYKAFDPGYSPNQAYPNPNEIYQPLLADSYSVESITLPPQAGSLKYEFAYNAQETRPAEGNYTQGWGELKSVTMPSGKKVDYQYSEPDFNLGGSVLKNHVTEKTITYKESYDGVETTKNETWHYELFDVSFEVTAPDGGITKQFFKSTWSNQTWDSGLVYATVQPDGTVINKIWLDKNLVKTEYVSVPSAPGQSPPTAIKNYIYDSNGNPTQVKEYDYVPYSSLAFANGDLVIPSNAVLKRQTVNEYYNPQVYNNDPSLKLKGILKSSEIRNGSGTPVSRSEFFYDDPNNTGNLTETRVWDSSKGALNSPDANGSKLTASNYVSSSAAYNSYGSPTLLTDAKGNQTQIAYGAISGPNNTTVSDLYPTQIVSAYNTPIAQTVQSEYDFSTGLVNKTTALGNTSSENVSSETIYDALGRPLISKAATGTANEIWTQMTYDDLNRRVISKSDLYVKGDGRKVSTQFYDQLGRVRLTKTLEDSQTQSATNETDGIKVQTRYQMGNPYSYQLSSNPYRAATAAAASGEPSMGWTRSKSINTGRHSEVETFAGASLPAPWGSNTNSSGVVSTDADADRTLVTDQAGKRRISQSNALGQLINVWEVKESDSDTEAIGFGNPALSLNALKTSYQYDTLSNLTTVNQGAQTRIFAYDSLSRLKSATNPESGIISYQYDNNGNLTKKTDARQVVTDYVYDELNRVKNRNYSVTGTVSNNYQATPNVAYTYDGAGATIPFSKGKLTEVDNGISKTKYTSFDVMGRVTGSQQITPGVTVDPQTYIYNLSGALIEEKYPSGRVVKNVLDSNGDLELVQSKKNQASGFWNYAKSFTYTAAGAASSMQLGNGKWESTSFNSRLQPTQIALGTVQNGTDNLKLNFAYNSPNNTTDNNGNVVSQTITAPAETVMGTNHPAFTATQNYTYDSLNRLKSAVEAIPGQAGWQQTFRYDRYGNRQFDEANTTTLPKNCQSGTTPVVCAADSAAVNPSVDASNNRLNGYGFDAAGNTKTDALGKTFTYDGENKQVKVTSGSTTVGEYFYDGDGKRVKKYVPNTGETTIFVYDASGKMVAEYSTIVALQQDAKVSYLTSDHLGSPRINTDANGTVISRHDYQPFGEEIGRASYGGDAVRKQFTSYERDNESGLDYAKARMLGSGFGRFTSPDPIAGSCWNPQSLNAYAYALNDPLKLTDPTGMTVSWEDSEKKKKKDEAEARTDLQRKYEKHIQDMVDSKDRKTHERGLKLQATYDRLQKSDTTFHVVKENSDGTSSGELTYKGQEGHLYINLKGNSGEYGALTDIQKIAHEFKHGDQFLDGKIGFIKVDGKWLGYRDEIPDEAEAFITGFEAQSLDPAQRSNKFLNAVEAARGGGLNAVVNVLATQGPYKNRSTVATDVTAQEVKSNPNIYAIPKK